MQDVSHRIQPTASFFSPKAVDGIFENQETGCRDIVQMGFSYYSKITKWKYHSRKLQVILNYDAFGTNWSLLKYFRLISVSNWFYHKSCTVVFLLQWTVSSDFVYVFFLNFDFLCSPRNWTVTRSIHQEHLKFLLSLKLETSETRALG